MYRIYAKHDSQRKFRPIDPKCNQVNNLIYAAIFSDEEKEKALAEICPMNPDWQFKAVKVEKS